MPTLKSRAILWLVRHRHLFRGRLHPEVVDANFDVAAFRARIARQTSGQKLPEGIAAVPARIGEMRAEWIVPENAPEDRVLMYIHGGGFLSGGCDSHRGHVAKFARETGLKCLLFDYRLAPEHPYPAAPDDVLTAYRWLLSEGYAPERIVVGGESAGATLTLSLLVTLAEAELPQPAAAFAISAHTDLACTAASHRENAARDLPPPGAVETWLGYYVANADLADPRLSPLFGDYTGVCPLHLTVGGDEVLRDDMRAVADRARQQGVAVTFLEEPGMVHGYPLLAPILPEATRALADISAFVRRALG